jgi:serine/threonine-protein kinase
MSAKADDYPTEGNVTIMEREMLKKIWPEWTVLRKLGSGAFGSVYEAVHSQNQFHLEERAAIKVISVPANAHEAELFCAEGNSEEDAKTYFEEVVGNFVQEIQLMLSLDGYSNHIVSIKNYSVAEKKDEIGWYILIRMELLTPYYTYIKNRDFGE